MDLIILPLHGLGCLQLVPRCTSPEQTSWSSSPDTGFHRQHKWILCYHMDWQVFCMPTTNCSPRWQIFLVSPPTPSFAKFSASVLLLGVRVHFLLARCRSLFFFFFLRKWCHQAGDIVWWCFGFWPNSDKIGLNVEFCTAYQSVIVWCHLHNDVTLEMSCCNTTVDGFLLLASSLVGAGACEIRGFHTRT